VARWRTAPKRHRCVPQPAQFSDPTFEDLRDQSRAFAAIAQYATSTVTVSVGDTRWRIEEASVSRQFFDVLGSRPTRGRTFTEDELAVGAAPVAVVSEGFWPRTGAHGSEVLRVLVLPSIVMVLIAATSSMQSARLQRTAAKPRRTRTYSSLP